MDYKITPRRPTIALVLFAVLILIGLVTLNRPYVEYNQPIEQALASMTGADDEIAMSQAAQLAIAKDPAYTFIDLRNPYDFARGHLEGALNIPSFELLKPENLNMLRDLAGKDQNIVLYGKDQASVNAATQLLTQVGISSVLMMRGGYAMLENQHDSLKADTINRELQEIPWYDYASLLKPATSAAPALKKEAPRTLTLKPKPAPKAAPAKQEEPQGC
jgi:rhodanese-related sulfurtransferase